ncbi:DNA polymerase I [Mycobacterium phage Thonko]|uniref:DNA-directed DNA polymerase n=1 Tax=Mycobacterium phage Thonko TaxID=2282910 RepID=A0A346FCA7_9CAUD|nr:DNA polymerase I [Mycobacterium phage Thonko]AXN53332.1 DNA polymerase I [Mycobacterium phage Thonko]
MSLDPRVPSRTIKDPVLNAHLATGEEALRCVEQFVTRLPYRNVDIAADIETPGLVNTFTINCVTAAWEWPGGGTQAVLLDPRRNGTDHQAVEDLFGHARTIAFHNAPFDTPPLWHAGLVGKGTIDRLVDTLLLARFALPDVKVGKSLGALATKYLGLTEFKGGMERAFKAAGYRTIEAGYEGMDIDSPVYRYGAMADTVATLRLEPLLRAMCVNWTLDHPFVQYGATTDAEAEAILHTQEVVHRVMLRRSAIGLNVDLAYLDTYREQVEQERNESHAALAIAGLEGGSGKGAGLVNYLDSIGELPQPWPRTPTGKLKATKADLDGLDHPLAAAQRHLASTDKVLGYLEKVVRQASVTGRCHPQVGVLGASATGRMSYSSPELQQFPKEARAIIADDGVGLTSIDWSQIEPVTMAAMARDAEFVAGYERGDDLYEPIMRAAGVDRDIAKRVLLGTMYGLGIAKLAAQIGHTDESAAQIRRQMFSAMPRCEAWMSKAMTVAETHGVVITAGGRILPVDPGFEYKAVNYAIQGSAYDVLAHTIEAMEAAGIADDIYLAMHDELVVATPVADEAQRIMSTPPEFLCRWAQRTPVLRTDRADMGSNWKKV